MLKYFDVFVLSLNGNERINLLEKMFFFYFYFFFVYFVLVLFFKNLFINKLFLIKYIFFVSLLNLRLKINL